MAPSETTPLEPSEQTVLSVRNLTICLPKNMERENAVENVSFDMRKGEMLCIVGESGSGKSVTANAIMGLLPSSVRIAQGSIRFKGHDLASAGEDVMRSLRGRSVSIIVQDPLSPHKPLMNFGQQVAEVKE